MNIFNIALDLDKGVTRQPQVVRIRQDDHDGTTINAVVCDHGERIDVYRFEHAFFCMRLPDGSHYYRKECSIQSFGQQSWVNAIVDEQEAASVTGRTYNAYFAFELVGRYYSTGSFAVIVEPSATSDASAAETYDSYIEDAIDNANAAADAAWAAAQQTIPDGSITLPKLASSLTEVIPMDALTNAEIDAITG